MTKVGEDSTIRAGHSGAGDDEVSLVRGDVLDHFIVVDKLGEGGMGLVLSAYDPDLDRKVAIKLLSPRDDEEGEAEATGRLLREAQAMAKLAHANVVTVYEVGIVDEQVFIAMEFVDGHTLGDWRLASQPDVAATVEVFVAAGRGLAAAHAVGLVHRDFKPGNVMVTTAGEVRVLDFGLARPALFAVERKPVAPVTGSSASALDTPLTRAGVVVGTPAYMAPEQLLGQAVDARTDQFSFCVALYEALRGERPFEVADLADLSSAAVEVRLRDGEVPGWLRRILARGLQPARADRYPTMAALLVDLQVDRRARWRRGAALVAALVVLAGAASAVALVRAGSKPCRNLEAHLDGVWDGERELALRDAFIATGRPYAATVAATVSRRLDDYTDAWLAMRRDACAATHERGEQSQSLLDLRMRCLDRRLEVVRGMIATYVDAPDGAVVDRAVVAVAELGDLDRCAEVEALTAIVAPPDDRATRVEVVRLSKLLDAATAVRGAGQYREALALVEPLVASIRALGYSPLLAEVLYLVGDLRDHLDDSDGAVAPLYEAAQLAAAARDDELAARVWVELIDVLSERSGFVEALGLVPVAEGWLARAGADGDLQVALLSAEALALKRSGDYQKARAVSEEALVVAARELAPEHPTQSVVLNNHALLLHRLGENDEALVYYQRKLAVQEASLPERHPSVANTLNNIGMVWLSRGKYDRAGEYFSQSLAMREEAFGELHLDVADGHNNLGNVALRKNELDEAGRRYRRALAIADELYHGEHKRCAMYLDNLASVYWMKGDFATTREHQLRALAIREKLLGSDHVEVAESLQNLAGALAESGDCRASLPHFERALMIREEHLGSDHPATAWTLSDLGNCRVSLGEVKTGLELLERALAIRVGRKVDPVFIADTRFHLARALWSLGQRKRALELARQAQHSYAAAGNADQYTKLVDVWLKKHL